MGKLPPIVVFNRHMRRQEIEKVFHDDTLYRLYFTLSGRWLNAAVLSRKPFNRLYGALQDLASSREKIAGFVEQYDVDLSDFEPRRYQSFNDFFVRTFRDGARSFDADPGRLAAPCEGRYLGFEQADERLEFPVKGRRFNLPELLRGRVRERVHESFAGGPLVVVRLCPVDYHRFHFPDGGRIIDTYRCTGRLHSVNKAAQTRKPDVLWTNERHVTLLDTDNFGRMAMIEVGAITVGRIVQTHGSLTFERGQEKGYFQFGGSSVVLVGERGAWVPDEDILQRSQRGTETLVRLGTPVARRVKDIRP